MKSKKPKRGRPRISPLGTRLWAKRLTPEEIAAVEKLVERMRSKARRSAD